jgi:transposase InsO family protein
MATRGIPTRLYIDNANIYRSPQLARIAASLSTLIIHSRPYQPEGRGKIERYFRSSVVDNRRAVMCSSYLCGLRSDSTSRVGPAALMKAT